MKEMEIRKNLKKFLLMLFVVILTVISGFNVAQAETTISKPKKQDPNASVYYKGIKTFYNPDNQKWKNMKDNEMLYSYKAKKDIRYYIPIFWFSNVYYANNGKDITVEIGKQYSKSVTKTVSGQLDIETTLKKVKLATSVSSSYSTTTQYSNDCAVTYTFDMSLYSKNNLYRPAAFGYIFRYDAVKKNVITGKTSSVGGCYTFKETSGCDLRLAFKEA